MRQDVVEFIKKVGIAPVGAYQPKVVVPPAPKPPLQAGTLAGRLAGGITNPNHVPFSQFKPLNAVVPNNHHPFFKEQLPTTAQNVLANQKVYSKPYPPKAYPVADLGSQKTPFSANEAYAVQLRPHPLPDPEINARLQKEREVLFRQMNPYMPNRVRPGGPHPDLPTAVAYASQYHPKGANNSNAISIIPEKNIKNDSDILGILTHEIEHTNQLTDLESYKNNPRYRFNTELAPSLREAAFEVEARRRVGIDGIPGTYEFAPLWEAVHNKYNPQIDKLYEAHMNIEPPKLQQPPKQTWLGSLFGSNNNEVTKQNDALLQQYHDKQEAIINQIEALNDQKYQALNAVQIPYERIRAEAERHGVFDGRSMTDVLSRPEARQYFQRMYQAVDPTDSVAPQTQVRPIQTDSVPVDNYQPKSWWQRMFSR